MLAAVLAVVSLLPVCDLATNSVASRLAAANPTNCLDRFLDYPPGKGKLGFPRCLFQDPFPTNSNFWLKDVDVSCASPWNDECGAQRAGTLISRRHIIFAKHFPLWKGCRVLFADQQGGVCPCRVEATKALEKCDIVIGLLDYEVTPSIRPAKILPDDYARYIGDGKGLPIVTFNQKEQVLLSEVKSIKTNFVFNAASTNATRKAFGGKMVVGDSGNPAFLLIGNEAILLYCLHTGGVGHGPFVFHYRKEIQKAMDELCPGYKLETFDFEKLRCDDGK